MEHKYKFLEWVDLEQNGILVECAIMQKFSNGDMYFFPISTMDDIDKRRFVNIITGRNSALYSELWRLLEQVTLGNGVNALIYFNQLVKVRTASGQIMPFGVGRMGAGTVVMQQVIPPVVEAPVSASKASAKAV
jgi:hypothetical protein